MGANSEYFSYLKSRSGLGLFYRRHWLYPRLARYMSGRAIDVGCGIGDMLAFRADTVGVDVNPLLVEFCRSRGLDAREMIPDQLPFDDGQFESALLDNVLEHLRRPDSLLAEVRRVLKKGGIFVVGVPGKRGFIADPDHKSYYDERSLIGTIQSAGFRHKETFWAPLWRSALLDRLVKAYSVYGQFVVDK